MNLHGSDMFGQSLAPPKSGALAERFEFPPFTTLNAREGAWQERKRAWGSLGIKSELGRGAAAGNGELISNGMGMGSKERYSQQVTGVEVDKDSESGTSIFDPVLCEMAYRWWSPEGGTIVDPFAGGSVRGIVAGMLGRRYWGCDLRAEQIEANRTQAAAICPDAGIEWVCGDSTERLADAPPADFVFSCPPYGDLERYSDDPADLSTMEYHTFMPNYRRIINRCAKVLKPGRFACFVVGDFRDKRSGAYRGFVADTIIGFRDAGLDLYNDAVLLTAIGSLPIRTGKQFEASRKLGKAHQNVLVFCKGKPERFW